MMNKLNLKVKSNNFHSKKKKQITVKIPKTIKKVSPKIEAIDEKLFLEQIEKFFTNEIIAQSPFDWKSWIPAGRSREYYHNLLIKDKDHFVQAYAKRSQEGYIDVYLIFGEGFNFDLVDFEKIKENRKLCFDEKCIIHRFYNNILSLPTWNYITNDWRDECLSKFSYRGRHIAPHPYWKVEKFIACS